MLETIDLKAKIYALANQLTELMSEYKDREDDDIDFLVGVKEAIVHEDYLDAEWLD